MLQSAWLCRPTSDMTLADDNAMKDLVCEHCWSTVFSPDAFPAMREIPSDNDQWYKEGGFKYETVSWIQLQEVAKLCQFCGIICSAITQAVVTSLSPERTFLVTVGLRSTSVYSASSFEILTFVVDEGSTAQASQDYTVCTTDDNGFADTYIHARGLPAPTNGCDNYRFVLRCIENCSEHEFCPRPTQGCLPTRIVDCIDPQRPHLVTADSSMRAFYVALSYVWGQDQPHRTTAHNIEAYHTCIDRHYIPKTVQDAITITKGLGVRYLWVDSFCIMQDSDEDKAQEIEKIRIYFRNAYVTIIAANAECVSEGFLHDPPKWYQSPLKLPFWSPDGHLGTMLLYRTYADWPTRDQPVDRRAWCLEERILSPRRLLFCSHALQFECQKTRVNVNGSPLGLPDMYPRLPDHTFTHDETKSVLDRSEAEEGELVGDWDRVLNDYTSRRLTKSKDKLVAIAGVAEQFQLFWPQSRYIAGLWTHQFPEALLWYVETGLERQPMPLPRPTTYRAPSWSWAAVDGAVETLRWIPLAQDTNSFCTIKHCEVHLKRETNPYGEVKFGWLLLEAEEMLVEWEPMGGSGNIHSLFKMAKPGQLPTLPLGASTNQEQPTIGQINPDSSEFLDSERHQVVLAGVLKGTRSIFGLALVAVCNEGSAVHRRIGWIRVDNEHWTPSEAHRIFHIV
ncbi:heterokaryon incompatibility protein-domain-containing protein [Mycena sanguinolenta]|nr:heterokaryon incompatibility protein-domain-containing protein [Mycena sanguinolenta]